MNYKQIKSKKEYLSEFSENLREAALRNILDIRKFEIDLYWKRASYFWTFIGATIGGYIALLNISNPTSLHQNAQFILIMLGIMFSLCWYFVNRGSKFWQLNWEKHLDVIEDELIGPLYKTTINRDYYKQRWYVLNGPYPFSVSKINIMLSLFVLILWVIIYLHFICVNKDLFYQDGIK